MEKSPSRLPPPGLAPRHEVLLANPFFAQMRNTELASLIATSSERMIPKGTRLFAKGDAGSFMATVLTGRLRLLSTSRDGREVTLNLAGPGEITGLIALVDGKPRSADAVATEDALLLITERRVLLPLLAADDMLARPLLQLLSGRLRQTIGALEDIALFDLPARLARLLVQLAVAHGQPSPAGIRIAGKLSQREMAGLVFSSRESVNKQLRVWRQSGVLTMTTGHIVLHDLAALQRAVDG